MRKVRSHCSVEGDGFLKVFNAKLPDLIDFWLDKNINLEECQRQCLKNCSCTAYANPDVRNGGSGCLMWFGDLIDMIEFREDEYEQILYLRLPASELGTAYMLKLGSLSSCRLFLLSRTPLSPCRFIQGLCCEEAKGHSFDNSDLFGFDHAWGGPPGYKTSKK